MTIGALGRPNVTLRGKLVFTDTVTGCRIEEGRAAMQGHLTVDFGLSEGEARWVIERARRGEVVDLDVGCTLTWEKD